jgi:hypothetical protein
MKWEVTGADRQTGADRTITLEAGDEAQARRRANRQGVLVADLRPLDPNDSVAGVRALVAAPLAPQIPLPVEYLTALRPSTLVSQPWSTRAPIAAAVLFMLVAAAILLGARRRSAVAITPATPLTPSAAVSPSPAALPVRPSGTAVPSRRPRIKSDLTDGIVLQGIERFANVSGEGQSPEGTAFRVYRLTMSPDVTCTLSLDGPRDAAHRVRILVPVFPPEQMTEPRSVAAALALTTVYVNTLPTLAQDRSVLSSAISWASENPGQSRSMGWSRDWHATIGSVYVESGFFITLTMELPRDTQ